MKLVTTVQMRALEQATVAEGATWSGLMEQAGWGVAQEALRAIGSVEGRRVLVLVGPGNNGGDGLVAARHLHDAGAQVSLYLWNRSTSASDINHQQCRKRAIVEYNATSDSEHYELQHLLAMSDLIVDALLGMGISRPIVGDLAAIIACVNQRTYDAHGAALVMSIDLPTGIDSDSGAVLGCAIRAHSTVATGMVKRGLVQQPGRAYAGAICLAEIGIASVRQGECMSEMIDQMRARALLPARPDASYKGTFGTVLVVAGSLCYPGAATLASAGAARVGAGLVTLATGRSALTDSQRLSEVTLRLLPEADWGVLGEAAADELSKYVEGCTALLVGPGLGHEAATRIFVERLLGLEPTRHRGQIGFRIGTSEEKPTERQRPTLPATVLDADALTSLSQIEHWWEHMPHRDFVLTPHPGEMRRLLKVEELMDDRVAVAEEAAKQWGQVVVLKGATTVIAHPDGRSYVHDGANAALATAGTGDVLAGIIVGLLAQGCATFEAAALGVYLHGAAGQRVREELGSMGALASDLLPRLPLAIRALQS